MSWVIDAGEGVTRDRNGSGEGGWLGRCSCVVRVEEVIQEGVISKSRGGGCGGGESLRWGGDPEWSGGRVEDSGGRSGESYR